MLLNSVWKARVTNLKVLKSSTRFCNPYTCRNQGYFSIILFIFELILLKIWIFVRMIVCMIWWLHVVELVFLMILIYYTPDLEFNNMFKFEFDFRILKLGFITRMNVLHWNLGVSYFGIDRCCGIVGCVLCEICNPVVQVSQINEVCREGSCHLKFTSNSPETGELLGQIPANSGTFR